MKEYEGTIREIEGLASIARSEINRKNLAEARAFQNEAIRKIKQIPFRDRRAVISSLSEEARKALGISLKRIF